MSIRLYGLREAALLWYRAISQFLTSIGFKMDPRSPCIFSKGSCRIGIHVDDLLFVGDAASFTFVATRIKARLNLQNWNCGEDSFTFTGNSVKLVQNEKERKVKLHTQQKIDELKCMREPPSKDLDSNLEDLPKLTGEEVTGLKGARGSLLFIGRKHPENSFPIRCLALGADADKDERWVYAQDNAARRLKQESPGNTIDLSYADEVFAGLPDGSFQQPTSDDYEKAGTTAEQGSVVNLYHSG